MADVTYPVAVGAGLISFLSPCVLPLVPPYLCYLAGASLDELTASDKLDNALAKRVLFASITFVLGFTTVFVALGAAASVIGQLLRAHLNTLAIVAGVMIIIMGLHFLGVFKISALYKEARYQTTRPAGILGAYFMGVAFAFGWTPCIGPVLSAILAVAAVQDTVGEGALLLGAYSLGLGIPFVAAAFAVKPFLNWMQRFRRHIGTVEKAMGGLLVLTGIMFITGSFTTFAYWLLEAFPALAYIG
ncbi:MAG: cytochrome c biogenesis protein CcdA [Alphaproteobacteria bacterium]|nr:cytochrome c biogenesis protein CcdA [Alphaproteobacteria bacterium]